jgi:hypothetical protein
MRWPFTLAGTRGHVDVVVAVNDEPQELGCRERARGFPYCSASISHSARGYAAALGSIQLVRSTDNASGGAAFEMDPFEPLGPVSHPFCFFGFLPALFDAPSRDPIPDMDWTAHSFLCRLGDGERQVHPVLGFSWGFVIRDAVIASWGPEALSPQAWEAQVPVLAREHPAWSFMPGFADS